MPGSGMTPALRPNCPGTHCPCASEAEAPAKKTQARNRTIVLLSSSSGTEAQHGSFRRNIRVGCAGTDGRLLMERRHVVEQDLTHWPTNPQILGKLWAKWVLLFRINVQIVEARNAVSLHFASRVVEFLGHHLP